VTALLLAVSLSLSSAPLPVDTVTVDSVKHLGVLIPTTINFTPGDLNYDGSVSTSDIMLLIGHVLLARALPEKGDTIATEYYRVTFPADTTKPPDTAMFLFIPTKGMKR
jgi:hypothetical protein